MKSYSISNDYLTASFLVKGAELCSLKDHKGTEYIWQADPSYWKRHAPILFPIVGKVYNNTYTHAGETYEMSQHGFARDMDFDVVRHNKHEIVFKLTSNEETHTQYPFAFALYVTYTLTENALAIKYHVENTDTQTMAFKIGAHPAFICPLVEDAALEDYVLTFECEEQAALMPLTTQGYFKQDTNLFEGNTIPLQADLFDNDAIVLTNLKSRWIAIESPKYPGRIEVHFENFPFLGVWMPKGGAPFICIEPWFGHADYEKERTEFMRKRDLMFLEPEQIFSCTHTIRIQ